MSYKNLEIQDGQLAGLEYGRMMEPSTTAEEKEKIKKNLLTYCGHDTLAMLKIRKKLIKVVEEFKGRKVKKDPDDRGRQELPIL